MSHNLLAKVGFNLWTKLHVDVSARHYVILDTTAKLIAITIRNRFLAIQHPVWIGELLLSKRRGLGLL